MRQEVRRVCLIGSGVIGAGWAARCLARGLDVVASDPGPGAEARLREIVETAWPAVCKLTAQVEGDPSRLGFTDDLEQAVSGADFVQESAPEREDLKIGLLARIDRVAAADVVIASSSSGLLPSRLQSGCRHPERVLIGHPFNPVYLLPLVEVLGGERTAAAALETAAAFYQRIGMHPLRLRRELEGFVANRLQSALWREALHLIAEGAATTAEIDQAVTHGPGLRWALMGPSLTHHLAGGAGGMEHTLAQFGPAMELPWSKLAAPALSEDLRRRLIDGTREQAGESDIRDLERQRDAALVDILRSLRQRGLGAGPELAADEARSYARRTFRRWRDGDAIDGPLALYRAEVKPEWLDYNGHMSESYYLLAFGDASDALFRYVGIDEAYRAAGRSLYTAESHINYFREAGGGEPLRFTTQLLGLDQKRVHLFHAMYHGEDGGLLATTEQMLLHVESQGEPAGPRVAPIDPEVYRAFAAIMAAHAALPRPEQAGRRMQVPVGAG